MWTTGLNALNWMNAVSYVLNLSLIYLSVTGIFGETNSALSSKYQTLVTPSGWAFSIWGKSGRAATVAAAPSHPHHPRPTHTQGPIFIGEGVFAVAQLLPACRELPIVQRGVSWWWAYVCMTQSE